MVAPESPAHRDAVGVKQNPLADLISLPHEQKVTRGLLHTPGEIAQQPATWESTARVFRRRRAELGDFLRQCGVNASPEQRPIVFMVGAGTSDYVGQAVAPLLQRHWQCEVIAIPSTDLLTNIDAVLVPERRYLWISFSRSGDSPEGVALLDRALRDHPEIHHLIVSCNQKGAMVSKAEAKSQALAICLDDAVNDRGLAMTSSFSNMVVFGQCLAHVASPEQYEPILETLVAAGKSFLPQAAELAVQLAAGSYRRACFVGTGALKGVARESALKLLEMTAGKTLTMSESSLGLRHGPMAALNPETLLVCFLSRKPSIEPYERDLLREIGEKRLVGTRVVVGARAQDRSAALAEHWLEREANLEDQYRPPLDVIFGQLLGLFFSLRWNLAPDNPSPNGAISRVVQNVNIYH